MDFVARLPLFFGLLVVSLLTCPAEDIDFPTLLVRAKAGDPQAELLASVAYAQGKLTPQDFRQAYAWSLEAAIQGNTVSERNMGVMYDTGRGVHANQSNAYTWYAKAAEDGDTEAQRAIGVRLQFGAGIPQNLAEADAWYRKAAIQGQAEAQSRLGDNLTYGIGCEKDPEQGVAYLLQSAAIFPASRFVIAKYYADGRFFPRDLVHAYGWDLMSPATMTDAKDLLATLKKSMTADQVKEANDFSMRLYKQFNNGTFQSEAMSATLADGATSVTMKFDSILGHIVVPFTLQNKEQVNFMIDTGCSTSVVDARVASHFNLSGSEYAAVSGIGANIVLATIAENVAIAGHGLNVTGARVVLLPDFALDEYLGHPLAGIIGTDILQHFVVQIDYLKKTLTFTLPGHQPDDPQAVLVRMQVVQNVPVIQAGIGADSSQLFPAIFLVDTGINKAISLTKIFQDNTPALIIPAPIRSSSPSLGGPDPAVVGRGTLGLAALRLDSAEVSLSQNKQGTWAGLNGGLIGEAIWSRFDLTLDFPGQKLLLHPNANYSLPFNTPESGLGIKTTGDYKTFVVFVVMPDSPASRVGLQKGDLIVKLDGKLTNTMTLDDIVDALKKEGTHDLLIHRDNADLPFKLPVYDPFKHPEQIELYRNLISVGPTWQRGPAIQSFAVQNIGSVIYPDDVMVRASGLKLGETYLPETENRAIKKLYATGLFQSVSVFSDDVTGGVKVTLFLHPNPVVQTLTFTGLTATEEAQLRPLLRTEEGIRTSSFDRYQDENLIRQQLGKANSADRTISMNIVGDDGSKMREDILVPKTAP